MNKFNTFIKTYGFYLLWNTARSHSDDDERCLCYKIRIGWEVFLFQAEHRQHKKVSEAKHEYISHWIVVHTCSSDSDSMLLVFSSEKIYIKNSSSDVFVLRRSTVSVQYLALAFLLHPRAYLHLNSAHFWFILENSGSSIIPLCWLLCSHPLDT